VLERIYGELAKLIARDIYDAAKKVPGMLSSLKATALTKSGSGLPEAVLKQFEEAFEDGMSYGHSNGFANWRDGKSEVRFTFRLTSPVINGIQKSDWAKAAKRTQEGNEQVGALGGNTQYQTLINNAVPQLVTRAIAIYQGHHSGTGFGWRILTPVATVKVAHRNMSDFAPHDLFYVATGSEDSTASEYKRAKRLLIGGWFRAPSAPFEGPYFD